MSDRKRRARRPKVDYKRLSGEIDSDELSANESGTENEKPPHARIRLKKRRGSDKHSAESILCYGNKHIKRILEEEFDDPTLYIQVVTDGSTLNAAGLIQGEPFTLKKPILVDDSPESIGLIAPKQLSVRDVAKCIGFAHPVNVMDVSSQEEITDWTLSDLVKYFECPIRLKKLEQYFKQCASNESQKIERDTLPKVLNQISLEFSKTPLIKKVRSPTFVRELDWIENAWPPNRKLDGEYPQVQHYCLTSTAECYTDFHIDFGGTSVWYHVISGEKHLLLIPPTDENLRKYEDWICNSNQKNIFFADNVEKCIKVKLMATKTLIIPTGWIHAVYTPCDSVVIGGNFLHSLGIKGQLNVHCIETRTNVPVKFRFPFFTQMMFFAGAHLLQKMRDQQIQPLEMEHLDCLVNALKLWNPAPGGDAEYKGSVSEVASFSARLMNHKSASCMIKELESRLNEKIPPINTFSPVVSGSKNIACVERKGQQGIKLRLSLPKRKSIQENTNSNIVKSWDITDASRSKFQIFVPRETVYSVNLSKKQPKHMKQDLSYVDDADDEWKPSSRRKKRDDKTSLNLSKISTEQPTKERRDNTTLTTKDNSFGDCSSVKGAASIESQLIKNDLQASLQGKKVDVHITSIQNKNPSRALKATLIKKTKGGTMRDRLKKKFKFT